MGRKLMRVPLDFNWPTGQVWKGYINPFRSMECKSCDGIGLNKETKKLRDDWYTYLRTDGKEGWQYHLEQDDVLALIEADRLWDFTRVPINEEQEEIVRKKIGDGGNGWLPFNNGRMPTAEEVNVWARGSMGHDSCNQWICVEARAKRLGVYGMCPFCNGEGALWQSDEIKKLHEEWQSFDPPIGEGYQLWETTTEGSPKSPVFKTLDELCGWTEGNATTFASYKATKEQWKQMLSADFVCHKEGNAVFI